MIVEEQRPTSSFLGVAAIILIFMVDVVNTLCPNGCLCTFDSQVLCQGSGLKSIPLDVAASTEHLSLSKNHIRAVPTDSFSRLPNIRKIILDGNDITEIQVFAFRGVRNAEEISVQNNPLALLSTYSFSKLSGISRLYLGYNKITTIAANAFAGSDSIREILLVGNPLTTLQSSAFSSLTNIGVLFLPPSSIRVIEPDSFRGLVNVSMIQLTGIQVEKISEYTFRGLTNVATLEMHDSDFDEISNRAFYGMANIDYLSFERNTFGKVCSDAFQGMSSIKQLKMEDNRFDDLEEGAFSHIVNDAQSLLFRENRIRCDCRLKDFQQDLTPMVPNMLEDNFCLVPDGMEDMRLDEAYLETVDDHKCQTAAVLGSDDDSDVKVASSRPQETLYTPRSNSQIGIRVTVSQLIFIVLLGTFGSYSSSL